MTLCLPSNNQFQSTKKAKTTEDFVFLISAGVLILLFIYMIVSPTHAYDAYDDIIDNVRFEGNIREIEWLVAIIDKGLIWIISFIGFFIISAAMLRNVLSGCYAAFPRLFDMLAETKEQFKNSKDQQGGVLKYVLSFCIPNVKPLTDFADGTASPRGYFTKSLILGVITVIIGVCIYNGLYRDLIREGAQLGTHVISDYILKIDFNKEFDKIMETGRLYKFIWANSKTKGDKLRQKVAKDVYLAVLSDRDDLRSKETRALVGSNVEASMLQFFSEGTGRITPKGTFSKDNPDAYLDSESWSCNINVSKSFYVPGRPSAEPEEDRRYFMGVWAVTQLVGLQMDEEKKADGGGETTAEDAGAAAAQENDNREMVYAFLTFTRIDLADTTNKSNSDDSATAAINIVGNLDGKVQGHGFNITVDGKGSDRFNQRGYYENGDKVMILECDGTQLRIEGMLSKKEGTGGTTWSPRKGDYDSWDMAALAGTWTLLKTSDGPGLKYGGGTVTIGTVAFQPSNGGTSACTVMINGKVKYGDKFEKDTTTKETDGSSAAPEE